MSSYSTANDYDYLQNSQEWIERIRVRLKFRAFKPLNEGSTIEDPRSSETYIQNILNGLNDLLTDYENPYKKKNIRSNLVGRGALYTYLIDKDLPTDLNAEHKKEIEAVFFATFIRLLLLEYYEQHPEVEYKRERENFKVKLQSSYPESVPDAEGCPDNKRYIIGGRSAKDTMRRLTLIEQMIINLPDANFAKKKKEKRSQAEMSTTMAPSKIQNYISGSSRPPGGEETAAVTMIGLKYTDVATAVTSNSSANASSNSNGDTKVLGDVIDLFHQVEFNPTALFKAFELLNENYQTSIEQDYDNELDSLYEEFTSTHNMKGKEEEEEEVDQSTLAVLPIKFIQPKMPPSTSVTIYKNKRDYVYNLIFNTIPAPGMTSANEPSITGKDRRNIPSLYEYTKNMTCGTFDLLKIFPNGGTSGTNPKLFEELPGTSIGQKSTSFNPVDKQQQFSEVTGAVGEEADKMNYTLKPNDDFSTYVYAQNHVESNIKQNILTGGVAGGGDCLMSPISMVKCQGSLHLPQPYVKKEDKSSQFNSSVGDIQILVENNGRTIAMDCSPDYTGYDIKLMIYERFGLQPTLQRLKCNTKGLDDCTTLRESNIMMGSEIHVHQRIVGGMMVNEVERIEKVAESLKSLSLPNTADLADGIELLVKIYRICEEYEENYRNYYLKLFPIATSLLRIVHVGAYYISFFYYQRALHHKNHKYADFFNFFCEGLFFIRPKYEEYRHDFIEMTKMMDLLPMDARMLPHMKEVLNDVWQKVRNDLNPELLHPYVPAYRL